MRGDSLEVYCPNKECGEPEVHSDITGHHETPKYRRMNYMGKKEIKISAIVANYVLNKETRPKGTYHLYQCPVCGTRRAFHESEGLTKEVDAKIIDEIK